MFKRIFRKGLVAVSIAFACSAAGNIEDRTPALAPFDSEATGRLFSVQGSNTVGASLMKNLLVNFFLAKGADEVDVVDLAVANEYRVQGFAGRRRIHVDVAAHGSSTGFRALQSGAAELAMSSRRIKNSEVAALQHLGDMRGFTSEHVIAIDGLAVIVNSSNTVRSLTLDQLADIFSGQVSNWKQVGGEDKEINLYARDGNSGTWDTFNSLVLNEQHPLSARAQRFESNDQLSDLVADDPQGIGFVGLASVRRAVSLALGEQGTQPLQPRELVVATEDYALSRRLFLYTSEREHNGYMKEFLAFIHSDRGQRVVKQTGFVSQNLISVAGSVEGPESYVERLRGAERLSVNLRFAEGSAELDNKAQRDIVRIADYMARPENAEKTLILIGFGDQKQNERRAVVLSTLRAMAVKSELFKRGILSEPVLGLGADLPVASNETAGRSKNRRVEVWVKGESAGLGLQNVSASTADN
ncbi:OmpA family protein [Proteobacteria bacterium 005FR1]|nr:OmpA family protein [Proteobacteria bacterium 005FR1]